MSYQTTNHYSEGIIRLYNTLSSKRATIFDALSKFGYTRVDKSIITFVAHIGRTQTSDIYYSAYANPNQTLGF